MCGLAGSYGGALPSRGVKSRLLKLLGHRGPDGSGQAELVINHLNLYLTHTRLAIIDLEDHALQPFSKDGLTIVFNGEIYNYLELRKLLISLGHTFRTQSDTEVVLAAYKQWGEGCVEYFEGMWSLAVADKLRNLLWLSRDRFGEKPLYYFLDDCGKLFFASEYRALISMLDKIPAINDQKINDYLMNGFRSLHRDENTWFLGVKEFPKSCSALIYHPDKINIKKYWQLKFLPEKMSSEQAEEGVKDALEEAINLRMRADVPISFCLSGGIDSSLILGVAAERLGDKVSTFSIIDKDSRYDESENINETVEYLGVKNHKVYLDERGFIERMRRLIESRGAPVSTISYYAHSFLSEEIARQEFKISISGTGADELFAGYYDHYNFWIADQAKASNLESLIRDWSSSFGSFVQNSVLKDPACFIKDPMLRTHLNPDSDFFSSLMRSKSKSKWSEKNHCKENLLRNRMLNDLFNEVVPVILFEDDANSMMHGIENRSPFLDRKLAEFSYKIPNFNLIKNGLSKYLLRSISKDYIPDSVRLDKRKRGFNASIKTFIDCSSPEIIEWLLEPGLIFDYIDREKFSEFLKFDMNSNSYSKFLFSFISVKLFLQSLKYNFPHGEKDIR